MVRLRGLRRGELGLRQADRLHAASASPARHGRAPHPRRGRGHDHLAAPGRALVDGPRRRRHLCGRRPSEPRRGMAPGALPVPRLRPDHRGLRRPQEHRPAHRPGRLCNGGGRKRRGRPGRSHPAHLPAPTHPACTAPLSPGCPRRQRGPRRYCAPPTGALHILPAGHGGRFGAPGLGRSGGNGTARRHRPRRHADGARPTPPRRHRCGRSGRLRHPGVRPAHNRPTHCRRRAAGAHRTVRGAQLRNSRHRDHADRPGHVPGRGTGRGRSHGHRPCGDRERRRPGHRGPPRGRAAPSARDGGVAASDHPQGDAAAS